MLDPQEDMANNIKRYTEWLGECEDAAGLSIHPTNDRGPYPYQWKIGTADFSRFLGYVIFRGPQTNGSDAEKKQHLCSLLRDVVI